MKPTNAPPPSSSPALRTWLFVLLAVFIVLHNDLWWWDDSTFVLGLPIALTYHLGYCLAAAVLMALLTRFAWPQLDETPVDDGTSTDRASSGGGR